MTLTPELERVEVEFKGVTRGIRSCKLEPGDEISEKNINITRMVLMRFLREAVQFLHGTGSKVSF